MSHRYDKRLDVTENRRRFQIIQIFTFLSGGIWQMSQPRHIKIPHMSTLQYDSQFLGVWQKSQAAQAGFGSPVSMFVHVRGIHQRGHVATCSAAFCSAAMPERPMSRARSSIVRFIICIMESIVRLKTVIKWKDPSRRLRVEKSCRIFWSNCPSY